MSNSIRLGPISEFCSNGTRLPYVSRTSGGQFVGWRTSSFKLTNKLYAIHLSANHHTSDSVPIYKNSMLQYLEMLVEAQQPLTH